MASKIDPKKIRTDLGTQSRVKINEETVQEYLNDMQNGVVLDPILVYYDESTDIFILVDGFHRFLAHMRLWPNDWIMAEQVLGSVEDARWASFSVNGKHGLKRSNADKRQAVEGALLHEKGAALSDVKIADHTHTSRTLVQNIRHELEASCKISKMEVREVQRGGKTYLQKITHIGHSKTPSATTSTCGNCRYFEDGICDADGDEKTPQHLSCEDFTVRVEERPPFDIPPPDKNALPQKIPSRKPIKRIFPNRNLKDCITVHLPSDNPQLFAIELREHWNAEYLTACIASLRGLLNDPEG